MSEPSYIHDNQNDEYVEVFASRNPIKIQKFLLHHRHTQQVTIEKLLVEPNFQHMYITNFNSVIERNGDVSMLFKHLVYIYDNHTEVFVKLKFNGVVIGRFFHLGLHRYARIFRNVFSKLSDDDLYDTFLTLNSIFEHVRNKNRYKLFSNATAMFLCVVQQYFIYAFPFIKNPAHKTNIIKLLHSWNGSKQITRRIEILLLLPHLKESLMRRLNSADLVTLILEFI